MLFYWNDSEVMNSNYFYNKHWLLFLYTHRKQQTNIPTTLAHPYLLSGHIGLNDIDDSFP